jgi:hypothetical protein
MFILRNRIMVLTENIIKIKFDTDYIYLERANKTIKVPLDKVSQKLKIATDLERNFFKISSSGYGIHWPLIDEDLSVDGLIKQGV